MPKYNFKKYATPRNIAVASVSLLLLIIVGFLIGKNLSGEKTSPITKDQIKIEKNGRVIIVNRNGLVEYQTEGKTYYQNWDSVKVSSFFGSMEAKAREYLSNPPPVTGDDCYQLTLYLDGELVSVCVSSDDEDINQIIDELDELVEEEEDLSVSDFFDFGDDEENGSDENGNGLSSPTPTISGSSGGGGNDDEEEQSSPEDNYPPVEAECSTWEVDIVSGRAIISNTLCTVEEPTPTPS